MSKAISPSDGAAPPHHRAAPDARSTWRNDRPPPRGLTAGHVVAVAAILLVLVGPQLAEKFPLGIVAVVVGVGLTLRRTRR